MTERDIKFMEQALNLGRNGEGYVNPNPMVGAIIVKNGVVVGKGYHQQYGGPHAEVFALEMAGTEAKDSTIYVTLEPCTHYGKTPPCVNKIIDAGIKRCVIAVLDPNPIVSGNGVRVLKQAGIEVVVGVLEKEAIIQNEIFFKYMSTKMPYLFLKCGITLDGKIATRGGDSKWITNEKSREKVQYLRHKYMGIMIGVNTLLADNPRLNARIKGGKDPYRIIIDPNLKIPFDCKFVINNYDNKSIIVTSSENKESERHFLLSNDYHVNFVFLKGKKFEMREILLEIGKLGIDSILLEGGKTLISKAFSEKALDGGEIFIAPKILGDSNGVPFIDGFVTNKISQAIELRETKFEVFGDNISLKFKV